MPGSEPESVMNSPCMDEEMVKKDYRPESNLLVHANRRSSRSTPLMCLKMSEKYQAVFQFAGDVILLVDDKGIITDANNKLVETWRLSAGRVYWQKYQHTGRNDDRTKQDKSTEEL